MAAFGVCLLLGLPKDSRAQEGFEYAYLAKFANDGECFWIENECTNDEGSTCNVPGSKSRGIKYCFPI